MNPNDLIDQTTGRIIPAMVLRFAHRRAAFLARHGHNYRAVLANEMRANWACARTCANCWLLERSTTPTQMFYTGGREIDGTMHERSV